MKSPRSSFRSSLYNAGGVLGNWVCGGHGYCGDRSNNSSWSNRTVDVGWVGVFPLGKTEGVVVNVLEMPEESE